MDKVVENTAIDKEINNMKCYLFRLAEEKWNLTNIDCSRLWKESPYYLLNFFEKCIRR